MTSVTIRMGAAHWDAHVHGTNVDAVFDFRKMTRDDRRRWYRAFMDSVRAVYGKPQDRRRPRRGKSRMARRGRGRR